MVRLPEGGEVWYRRHAIPVHGNEKKKSVSGRHAELMVPAMVSGKSCIDALTAWTFAHLGSLAGGSENLCPVFQTCFLSSWFA